MFKPILALIAVLLLFLASGGMFSHIALAQTDGCTDAIDNDDDGFVNDGCPAVGLSEAPEVTATPVAEPTATAEPTAEPTAESTATQEPTPTPSGLPDTGGDPGPGGSLADQTGVAFTTFEAETGLTGLLVTVLVTLLTVSGLALSSKAKQVAALAIGVISASVYVALRSDIPFDAATIGAALFTVLASSQVGYLLADKLLKQFLPVTDAYKKSQL